MTKDTADRHLTLDVLADYFAEILEDEDEERIESHIAGCDRCAARAQWIHSSPQPSLEGWTARAHGEAVLRTHLAHSIGHAGEANADPTLRERLTRWKARLAQRSEEAFQLIRKTSGRLSSGLDVLSPPPGWALAPSLAPSSTGMPAKLKGDRSQVESSAGEPSIHVRRRGIGVEVLVRDMEAETPRLVALIPVREGGQPSVRVLTPVPGANRTMVARFKLDSSDFVIAIEPGSD